MSAADCKMTVIEKMTPEMCLIPNWSNFFASITLW